MDDAKFQDLLQFALTEPDPEKRARAFINLTQSGSIVALQELQKYVLNPPCSNDPEGQWFPEALQAFERLLSQTAQQLKVEYLQELAKLEDIHKDVIYYLKEDPLYDIGHDFIYANYSAVREIARRELTRRHIE